MIACCAGAGALFVGVSAFFFVLGGHGAIAGFGELRTFQAAQLAENFEKYGRDHPRVLVYLRALLAMEPGTALLAPVAVALARGRRSYALAAVAGVHAVFLTTLVGHAEARYLLPALPPLAALGALVLDRVTNTRAKSALAGAWLALPLVLAAPYETRRALDPVFSRNASAEIAHEVAAVSTSGPVYFTPDLPTPVFPRVLARGGTPFPGDPFHGIHHVGPLTIGYHLERPVVLLVPRDERGEPLRGTQWLEGLAKDPRFPDGSVVIVGASEHTSWLTGDESPPIEVYSIRPALRRVAALRIR